MLSGYDLMLLIAGAPAWTDLLHGLERDCSA